MSKRALSKRTGARLRVAVDTKNLALYTGGIAAFFRPLLRAWLMHRPDWQFVLVGPRFDHTELSASPNCLFWSVPWPAWLPRQLRHPFYDNVLFPRAMRAVKPDAVFSPYHDVRLPRGVPSVMMVHDTCLQDLPKVYPFPIRSYYLTMLKRNLTLASRVLTVSEVSKRNLLARYGIPEAACGVVPNAMDERLTRLEVDGVSAALRSERGAGLHIFYPGGPDRRKNTRNLSAAILVLARQGADPQLWITGSRDGGWAACLGDLAPADASRFHFLGRLSVEGLAAEYRGCDVVVYPTICEGFGRVALEAMELGVPLACSDIDVLREVAADYPVYFDPHNAAGIAAAIQAAASRGDQPARRNEQFQHERVTQAFLAEMDEAFCAASRCE